MKKFMLFTVLLCGFSAMAIAQGVPKLELFGGYSYNRCDAQEFFDQENGYACNLNGWNGSVSMNPNKLVGVVADFGGYYGKVENIYDLKIHSIMIGPKIAFRSPRVTPFVQALFGWGHITTKRGTEEQYQVKENDFAMAFGAGLDLNISEHFAVRPIQVDYFPIKSGGKLLDNFRYSGGVVFKLAVSNEPPTVSCAASDASILQGDTATVRANAVDPEHARLTYSWSVSGGKVTGDEDTAVFDATGVAPGQYTVTATVSDKKNEVSCSSEITVLKRNKPPTASVQPSSFTVTQGESANLSCIGSDPNNDKLTYSWSVNGQRLAATTPQITFGSEGRAPGAYKVTCEVSDGDETASASSDGTVKERIIPNKPPTTECLTTTMDVASGGSIELRARATDPDGDQLTYSWSATGGTVRGTGATATFDATGVSAGSYTVTATATDGRGGKSSCSMTVNVSERISVTKENCGFFRVGGTRVDNCAKAILDDLAVRMKNNSSLRANVIGYTDGSSYERSRKDLGERRAKAVADYLEKQGVDASRMTITNGGDNDPVGDNKTASGRKLNRRVEIELSVK